MSNIIGKVYQSLQSYDPHSINIYINDHEYNTNLYIGMAICNTIHNEIYLNRSTKEFRFYANITENNIYDVLEKIFKLQIPENVEDNIACDLLNLGKVMESESLMSFFMKKFQNGEYNSENILINVKYSKQIGYSEKIFDFICENIDSINHDELISSIVEAGLDFAEQLLMHFKKRNKNSNDIIFSLININSVFIDTISYLNDEYIEIRDANDLLKSSSEQSSIISFFKTLIDNRKEKENKIQALDNELTELRQANKNLSLDNSNMKNELTALHREIEELRKEESIKGDELLKSIDEIRKLRLNNSIKDNDYITWLNQKKK
ncbi:hypothetical protein TVAG_453560 [Trichomonas vaginalis G3]|uniref:Uncharacterized protein n=1 Tax=Trichomonas vaginalis (strain ATCC PRA-98 / G3) TaxID=412133 RepID=A2DPT2_TRIV3|nr:EP4 subtype prostaglandin E2 receptor binding [Trichomonas vaginalis G3]EAY17528.1 hypothetical protein TVAG_453560 [Trichomonas vaginalis G3]KAI5520572.1 EP4 subtype prostaglandin E2 receptor binding [Trichomonas vaginalis G3]|eukprot:XP_001329663.1 hypothetical protein [Trichomonas vaginalis G3]